MNWLIFFGTFVNKMCRDKLAMILLIWMSQFIVPDDELEFAGPYAIDQKFSTLKYNFINSMALLCAIFAIPMYGYLNDWMSTGTELLVAYGVRAIGALGFYLSKDPNKEWITWSLVFFMLAGNF